MHHPVQRAAGAHRKRRRAVVGGLDHRTHCVQRVNDAAHGTTTQRRVAVKNGHVTRLPHKDSRHQAHEGAGVHAVDDRGRSEPTHAAPGDDHPIVGHVALHLCPKCANRLQGCMGVFGVERVLDGHRAVRNGTEQKCPVREGLVRGNRHGTREGGRRPEVQGGHLP